MEAMALLAAAVMVAAQGAWLGIGAFENIRGPRANGDMVSDVMSMRVIKQDMPDLFALFGGNRMDSPRTQMAAFGLIVIVEAIAAILMLLGAVMLVGAAIGLWPETAPRIVATLGTLGFILVWSGFLVGGQWFHYWAVFQNAQHTHFLLAIWGGITLMILLRV